jgi:hypothetical protein
MKNLHRRPRGAVFILQSAFSILHFSSPVSGCVFSHANEHSITLPEGMWFNGEPNFLGQKCV